MMESLANGSPAHSASPLEDTGFFNSSENANNLGIDIKDRRKAKDPEIL